MIPKEVWYYHSIGLVGVVWKLVMVILNLCITTSISFHDVIHRLWACSGTWTASLEAKLFQQLMSMDEEVLYAIFLDLHKSYDALGRYICLYILGVYGVGPQDRSIFCTY